MKTLNIFLALALATFSANAQNETEKKETLKVWGNCGMCQSNIEKAAKAAGATSAKWDLETHILSVSYVADKSSIKSIEEKVASVGYDTKNLSGNTEAYNKLHSCCKYDRKSNEPATNTPPKN